MQEKQDYIKKIQDLIESKEEENLTLALQLMAGLDLTTNILEVYGLKKEYVEKSKNFEINLHKQEKVKEVLTQIEDFTDVIGFNIKLRKKVFNIVIELIEISLYKLKVLEEKINVVIHFGIQYLNIQCKIIVNNSNIQKEVKDIDIINSLLRDDIINHYKTGTHTNIVKTGIHWLAIKRRSRNPI